MLSVLIASISRSESQFMWVKTSSDPEPEPANYLTYLMIIRKKIEFSARTMAQYSTNGTGSTYDIDSVLKKWTPKDMLDLFIMVFNCDPTIAAQFEYLVRAILPQFVYSKGPRSNQELRRQRRTTLESVYNLLPIEMFEELDSSYPNETLVNGVEYFACVYGEISPQKACELRSQVFEARRRIHGIEHPVTLSALNNLVCAYSRRGYWAESEKLQLQIIQARVKTIGPTHTDTIQAAANYALILMKLHRVQEAIESLQMVVNFGVKVLGKGNADLGRWMRTLEQWKCRERRSEDRWAKGRLDRL
jgi:hypothetical protein